MIIWKKKGSYMFVYVYVWWTNYMIYEHETDEMLTGKSLGYRDFGI